MLESIRRGQRWLVGVIVAVVGGVFVFFMGWGAPQFQPHTTAVVELGDLRFQPADFERTRAEREAEYRRLLGDKFDSRQAEDFLREQSLGALVDRAVLAREAEQLGLRVTDEELRRVLRDAPIFRDENGRFSVDRYRDWVQYEYGREENFKRDWRSRLLASKAVELLQGNVTVSEAEARMAALHDLEQVRVAYVALDRTSLPPGQAPTDDEIASWLAEHEDEARLEYDANLDRYSRPEQVRIRQIFVRPAGEDEAAWSAARGKADDALARIREGADFADVALEVSDLPESGEQGELFTRGEASPAIESVAWTLEPGQVSDVVRGEDGFHIVKVEERRAAGAVPFAEVKEKIARELAVRDAAERRARELADRLSAAVAGGASLENAARAEGLTLGRTALVNRRPDGYLPGVGGSPEAMATAFALEPGQSSPRIFQVGDNLVLLETLEREEPEPDELAKAVADRREQLLAQKRAAELQDWINARRSTLAQSGALRVSREALQ